MSPRIEAIYIGTKGGEPLRRISEARLEPGRGIEGDRYYLGAGTFSEKNRGKPDSEVTLIEAEEIERFCAAEGSSREPGVFRRNLVTRDVRLNELVGRRFRIGAVELEGLRLCEPCAHLATLVSPAVLERMVHRAGLRARVVQGGSVRAGDPVHADNAPVRSEAGAGAAGAISGITMTRLIPMLPVRSLAASLDFYCGKLGFEVENREDAWGWAMIRFDQCRLMLDQSINSHGGFPRDAIVYLYPSDVVEYHRQVRARGLAAPDLDVTFYGLTEFRVDDPDGNRLWIGQAKATAG
ncbi:MAG: MOSC domain-containing protein [Candidatus Eisenbacteria bacterium]